VIIPTVWNEPLKDALSKSLRAEAALSPDEVQIMREEFDSVIAKCRSKTQVTIG
jgi:hypothetical protein